MRKASPHTALRSKGIVALAAACAACVVALAGAQAADAAFSVSGATAGATSEQTAQRCRGERRGRSLLLRSPSSVGERPRHVDRPRARPGRDGAAQYPNGHIECLPSGGWDCVEYFNWSFGEDPVVILQARPAATSRLGELPRPRPPVNRCRIEQRRRRHLHHRPLLRRRPPRSEPLRRARFLRLPPPLNVRVVKNGAGSGTVSSGAASGFKINCGTKCRPRSSARPRHPDRDAGVRLDLRRLERGLHRHCRRRSRARRRARRRETRAPGPS